MTGSTITSKTLKTAAATDEIPINDVAGGNLDKKITVQGIMDLVPGGGDMILASAQTNSGAKSFNTNTLKVKGATSGSTIVNATAVAGAGTVTLPTTGTLSAVDGVETLTNKTLTSPTLTTPVLGTPSSGTLTSCTGLPITGITSSTSAQLATLISDETGTDKVVFNTSPTLVTPLLGTPTSGVLTNCTGYPTTGLGLTASPLSQFAATTSAQLAGVLSDETGTDKVVFNTTPTLVTPVLGVATATSINKVAVTAPATSATLTIVEGATLTASATASVSGTNTGDQSSIVGITGTKAQFNTAVSDDDVVFLDSTDTITGAKTFGSPGAVGKLKIAGTTSGSTILDATAAASGTLTLPAATDTLVGKATTDTLTNKTLTSPTLTTPVLGTPSSGTLTSCTGLPITGITSSTSAQIATLCSDETGSGLLVFATNPVLTTPNIGTPSAGTLTNCTGLPLSGLTTDPLARANHTGTQTASTISDYATATATFTNKTLTAPKFADLGFIADANGAELVTLGTVASAVNEIKIANAATATNPSIIPSASAGSDTNTGILLAGKGTGLIQVGDGADNTKIIQFDSVGATTAKKLTIASSHTLDRTITMPNATDTLMGKATTDTMTNKTFDANGTGNSITNIDIADHSATGTPSSSTYYRGDNTWATVAGGTNALLDGSNHTDTAAGTVARGDVIVANSTPKWARLAKGGASTVLASDGTDVAYKTITFTDYMPCVMEVPQDSVCYPDVISLTTGADKITGFIFPDGASTSTLNFKVICPTGLAGTPAAKLVVHMMPRVTTATSKVNLKISRLYASASTNMDTALTAETAADVTLDTSTLNYLSVWTFSLTANPTTGQYCTFQIKRDPTAANDNLAGDLFIMGIMFQIDRSVTLA